MNRHTKFFMGAVLVSGLSGRYGTVGLYGQEPNPTAQMPSAQDQQKLQKQDNGIYIYRVKVVQRDLDAVNYLHRSGSTLTPMHVRSVAGAVDTMGPGGSTPLLAISGVGRLQAANLDVDDHCEDT